MAHKKKPHLILSILLISSISGYCQNDNSKVEFYLLKDFVFIESESKSFTIDIEDLSSTPFISDKSILGYDTLTYEFLIDTSACYALMELKPSLPIGIQFALTVDGIPILSGYFWNPISSFGCDWYTISAICDGKIRIHKGLPEHQNGQIPELRNDERLIKAIINSNRVIN